MSHPHPIQPRNKLLATLHFAAGKPEWIWITALIILPFASYLSLAILIALILGALGKRYGQVLRLLGHQGYGLLTLGLVFSAGFSVSPGDSWLQLANFLPYFLLVGVLATAPRWQYQTVFTNAAKALVLGSLPFSIAALIEYIVRFPSVTAKVRDWPIFHWIFDVSFNGHRAHAGLSHPNILGNYLVIILGLGLGLLLLNRHARTQLSQSMTALVAVAVTLAGMGIFFTSSRNSLIAAVALLLIAGYGARRYRWMWLVGFGIVGAIATGLAIMGFGGRALTLALFTNDPRVTAWQIALELIQQRPLVGWGLGGFSHEYVPFSVTDHERLFHPHNLWLYLACDTGIPTMLLACWVIGRTYVSGIRRALSSSTPTILLSYLLAFTGCILFALFDVTLFDARINVLSWFLVAGMGILAGQNAQQPTAK
ncbi:MAG: O-antigen ligase family protein [Cyanobacteria bacterium P01_D01_bin.156]